MRALIASNAVINFKEDDPFDPKAVWLNAEHIRALPVEELSRELRALLQGSLPRSFVRKTARGHAADPRAHQAFEDAVGAADFFFLPHLAAYDPAELIPQKGDARHGAPRAGTRSTSSRYDDFRS